MRILILGGSGFIGRHAAAALRERGHGVVIGTRHPRRALAKLPPALRDCDLRETHLESLTTRYVWQPLLQDVEVVLNCVGILRERWGGESYEALHHRAPALLAQACRARGLRYLHVSALGLRHPHRSGFLSSKLAGEQAIVAAGGDFRIVRPSLLDGRGGFGALYLRALAALPLHFHARAARGRIAALDVAELGEALAALCVRDIADAAPVSERCFELGGLQAWPLADYLGALRGRAPWARLRIPDWLCRLVAHGCDLLHFSPFSFGHWELLQHDNLPQPNRLPELLGRAPRAIGRARAAPVLSAGSPVEGHAASRRNAQGPCHGRAATASAGRVRLRRNPAHRSAAQRARPPRSRRSGQPARAGGGREPQDAGHRRARRIQAGAGAGRAHAPGRAQARADPRSGSGRHQDARATVLALRR